MAKYTLPKERAWQQYLTERDGLFRTLPRMSRREFFRSAGRYALLAALAAIAAVTRRKQLPGGQRCVNQGICRNCGAFAGCELPQALSARRAQAGG